MEQKKPKPRSRPRYGKSTDNTVIDGATQEVQTNKAQRLLPGVNELLHEVKNLKEQLSAVKEEKDDCEEEVKFLKYQLAYRAQVQTLQKEMSENRHTEKQISKKQKSVRFSSSVSVDDGQEGEISEEETKKDYKLSSNVDMEELTKLKAEKQELEDVLYDFYHDSKMVDDKERVLVVDIDSDSSKSIRSLICRVLVEYERLREEHRILEEEKSKLDEDKVQLCASMAKLRENFHDAVDSNIEEIEDLNRENEELRSKVKTLEEKDSELRASFLQSHENTVSHLKSIIELTKSSSLEDVSKRLKQDVSRAKNELKMAKDLVSKPEEEKGSKLKRVQSLPSSLREETAETPGRGGLLRELKTCKDLQESQRKQIQKIQEEKLVLEVQLSEIKRQNVLLKAERRGNIKTKSRLVQTETMNQGFGVAPLGGDDTRQSSDRLESLSRKYKELERKLEETKREKSTAEEEKTSLLMSLYANIEKKDALEEQLNVLQAKLNEKFTEEKSVTSTRAVMTQTDSIPIEKDEPSPSETDRIFQGSYKKDISEVKVEIEKIRCQELDKQITILKRENEAVKEKLKRAEDMSKTLQNCLKELTDEKHELLDSIEELNEEKAELEETRLKLEKELSGTTREKFIVDEVSDIRNKERKLGNNIEASKAKLTQLDLKVVEVLSLIGNGDVKTGETNIDSQEGVEDMIGSLLSTVENLKLTVSTFKTTYDKTKGDSSRMKDELQAISQEKNELQIKVDELEKRAKEMAVLLESSSKPQASEEFNDGQVKEKASKLEKELEKMHEIKNALEKSLSEARKRDGLLERQLKDVRGKRDGVQKAFDQVNRQCNETTLLLADTKKEVEQSRRRNEQLIKEIEQMKEDLENTVEERDELLELLDRIVSENGNGEERQEFGLKVERIRERSRSEESLADNGLVPRDPVNGKPVQENFLVSRQMTVESSSLGENELFITVPDREAKTERKSMNDLLEENTELKEMVEKMINDQKRMEVALSSFSEANAEIRQNLEDSIEQTEQIQVQGLEEDHGNDIVDYGVGYKTKDDDNTNAELRRLHEVMVGTNEALEANLRRLQEEKVRTEQLRNSWQEISKKNETLEREVESLTKDKVRMERELSTMEVKQNELEKKTEGAVKERQDMQKMLKEAEERVKDLKSRVNALTETNKSLSEANERVSESLKETEKKWSKLNDEFDELEFEHEALERVNKRLQQQLDELTQQKSTVDLELERSQEIIVSLRNEVESHSERSRELQGNMDANEREFKSLRETASKVSLLQEKADGVDVLKSEIGTLKKTIVEREKRVRELEDKVSRLYQEVENSQRFVKDVGKENNNLRDSLSDWEREVKKLRQHVLQVSQDAEPRNKLSERSSLAKKEVQQTAMEEMVKSAEAFEAMQVEMDAINKHLKSLANENKELNSSVKKLSKENNDLKDRNIQLLTRYDMVSKELEKKTLEINKLNKDLKKAGDHAQTNIESHDKLDRENSLLQMNCEKLERENAVLKNSLASTLNEQRVLGERLKSLVEATPPKFRQPQDWESRESEELVGRPRDITNDELSMRSEVGRLNATKPDLIRHSKEAKDESIVSGQVKFNGEYFVLENSGVGKDAQQIVKGILKERVSLNRQLQDLVGIFQEIKVLDSDSRRELEEALEVREKIKVNLEATKASLEKTNREKAELEKRLEERQSELTEVTNEKSKLELEATVIKEKSDKLQAVFRALIQVMNDKKGKISGEKVRRQSDESEGSMRLIDYIKNIKTKYTELVTENERLEEKVNSLNREIDDYRTKQKPAEDVISPKKEEFSQAKTALEEKERILKELLLTSARDKRRFVEKLQEVHEELTQVKTQLGEEIRKQREASPTSVLILERVYQEFVESVSHTETFIQSVVHERRATVVADFSSEKDPDLELAKENEELIGKINAIQTSRRREMKSIKEELSKVSEEKEDAIRTTESKWKNEMQTMKEGYEKSLKEKEQLLSDTKNSWKDEVDQLKHEIRRISDENEVAQQTLRNETCLSVEKLENQNKLLKEEVDKVVVEKREIAAKMAQMKRESLEEAKEKQRLTESEIQHLHANWADAERKVRTAAEEKQDVIRKLEQVNQEKNALEKKAEREMQRLSATLEYAKKQSTEREDAFKIERERLQRVISALNDTINRTEVSGLERTQTKISEFQQTLEELAKQNKQLENAKHHTEQSLNAELDKLRKENAKLQQELREFHEQRRVVVNSKEQPRIMEPSLVAPPAERVKVLGSMKQPPVDKPKLITPLEGAPASIPGPGESQRRVKVREGQTAVIHKGRVQGQGTPRTSDHRDPVFEELGAIFQQLNEGPEWTDDSGKTTSVIQATPLQARTLGTDNGMQAQEPQPEWETERQDKSRPLREDPPRNVQATTWPRQSSIATTGGKPNGYLLQPGIGHVKEDKVFKRPSNPVPNQTKTKSVPKQAPNTLDTTKLKKSSAENLERLPVEVKKLPVGRNTQSVKSSRPRRPSIGSDDVFLSASAEGSPTFTSHGSKQGDFWRSQSLTNLTETSDEKKLKPPGQHTSRKHKQKLPKSFSGPRKGKSGKQDNVQATGSASAQQPGRSEKDSKAKKVLPLKGMEYVVFQHQI